MSLRNRISKMELHVSRKEIPLPVITARFIEPLHGENGTVKPGHCVATVRLLPNGEMQWNHYS